MSDQVCNGIDDKRLSRLETTVERLVFILEEDSKHRAEFRDRIETLLKDHTIAIYGDRSGVGLNSRVKTLEDSHKNHQQNIRWAWGAVGLLIIKQIWSIFTLSFVK